MDYFEELLSSYHKLKKRSFKLRYISEAEGEMNDDEQARSQAVELVKAGINFPFDNQYKRKGVPPYAYLTKATKNKPAVIQLIGGPVGSWAMEVGDAAGNPIENSEGFIKLVNYFKKGGDSQKKPGEEGKEGETEPRDGTATLVGKQPEEVGFLFATSPDPAIKESEPDLTSVLRKITDQLEKICKGSIIGFDQLCRKSKEDKQALVGGGKDKDNKSLEYALANSIGFDYEEGVGFVKRDSVDPALIEGVLKSVNDVLTSLLQDPTQDGVCEAINERMGVMAGPAKDVVFYKQDTGKTQGIVLKSKNLTQAISDAVGKRECKLHTNIYKGGNVSNLQGRFNEISIGTVISVLRGVRDNSKDAIKEALAVFLNDVVLHAQELTVLATQLPMERGKEWDPEEVDQHGRPLQGPPSSERPVGSAGKRRRPGLMPGFKSIKKQLNKALAAIKKSNGGISLDSADVYGEMIKQLELATDSKALKQYLQTLLAKNVAIFKNIDADASLPLGESQELGLKIDSTLAFVGAGSQRRALKAAKAFKLKHPKDAVETLKASEVLAMAKTERDLNTIKERFARLGIKDDDEITIVNTAQKFSKSGSTRQGQLGVGKAAKGAQRSTDLGPQGPADYSKYYDRLTGMLRLTEKELTRLKTYGKKIGDALGKTTHISTDTTFWGQAGLTTISATKIAERVRDELLASFPIDNIPEILQNTITRFTPAGVQQKVDLTKPDAMRTLQESVQRAYMLTKIEQDLADPTKSADARAYMVNVAGMVTMDMKELAQIVSKPNGETFYYDHNELVRRLGETYEGDKQRIANGEPPKLDITVKGATVLLTFPAENGQPITMRLGLQRQGDTANWICETNNKMLQLLESYGETTSDIFYEFLKGQQVLLEKLLTPSIASHNSLI